MHNQIEIKKGVYMIVASYLMLRLRNIFVLTPEIECKMSSGKETNPRANFNRQIPN